MRIFFSYQLYLLQLENYELRRFWLLLFKKGFFYPNQPLRKDIVWTKKAFLILILSLALIFIAGAAVYSLGAIYLLFLLFLSATLFPVYLTISTLLLLPVVLIIKKIIIGKARKTIGKEIKVIGIAGSYGKTTAKEIIKTILKQKYEVSATPDSVNTPLGIAKWILDNKNKRSEILIIEMGEHYRGDIAELCNFIPPDLVVITGITEAHLERMGGLKEISDTIFEAVDHAKKDALVFFNKDDENINKDYERHLGGKKAVFYSAKDTDKKFDADKLNWHFSFDNFGEFDLRLLGEYSVGTVIAGIKIAEALGLNKAEITRGVAEIEPISHRLSPIKGKGDVLVIDDSYNSNPKGAHEAILLLSRFKGRRKLYITPGIVETGSENKKIHTEIGKELATVADKVILIKNSSTPYIERGLIEAGFDKQNIATFETANEAHDNLGLILQPKDVIIFQNDWGDQYL